MKTSKPKPNQQIKFVVNGETKVRYGYYISEDDVFVEYNKDNVTYDRKNCKWEEQ